VIAIIDERLDALKVAASVNEIKCVDEATTSPHAASKEVVVVEAPAALDFEKTFELSPAPPKQVTLTDHCTEEEEEEETKKKGEVLRSAADPQWRGKVARPHVSSVHANDPQWRCRPEASGISLQSEVAHASAAVKLKEALDEGKMSKRDLAESAKAAALSDKLQELEIEPATTAKGEVLRSAADPQWRGKVARPHVSSVHANDPQWRCRPEASATTPKEEVVLACGSDVGTKEGEEEEEEERASFQPGPAEPSSSEPEPSSSETMQHNVFTFEKQSRALYLRTREIVTVVGVHAEDPPTYYTIQMPNRSEKQTTGDKLEPLSQQEEIIELDPKHKNGPDSPDVVAPAPTGTKVAAFVRSPSVKELKATLADAFVSYDGVTEKEELVSLVEALNTKKADSSLPERGTEETALYDASESPGDSKPKAEASSPERGDARAGWGAIRGAALHSPGDSKPKAEASSPTREGGWGVVRGTVSKGSWNAIFDKKSGKTYYFNSLSKKTVWAPPAEYLTAAAGSSQQGYAATASSSAPPTLATAVAQETPPVSHAGWTAIVDKGSGKMYYWNESTHHTVWKAPPEFLQAAGAR